MAQRWSERSGAEGDHGVTGEELEAVLGAAHRLRLEDVDAELIFSEPAVSATLGIWRFSADGWSAVLKVLRHSTVGSGLWQSGREVDHWYYWRREAEAYSSGLLAAFAVGARAPACLGVFNRPDSSVGIWLEDVGGATPAAGWDAERHRVAAAALGRAQGRSRTVAGQVRQPWLARDWLRRFVERRGEFLRALDGPGWGHPMVVEHLPTDTAERAVAIWEHRHALLDMVEATPVCLTHNDVHPGNLFALGSATVLIDWGFLAVGRLGEDPGNLVFDAVLDFFVAPASFGELAEAVTEGYLGGVADTVPGVDLEAVRKAIWATGAVRYFWIPLWMVEALAEERTTLNRRPIEEAVGAWAQIVPHIFEFADQAQST